MDMSDNSDIEDNNIDCTSGFIAKEYENLIPCEICNTLVNFEDYNEHISNCNNPFNNLFSNMFPPLSNNPSVNSIINNPQVIFIPMNNNLNNLNNLQNTEPEENDLDEENSDDEIQININDDNNDDNNDDDNTQNANLNQNGSLQNILNNLVQNIINNNDYNIDLDFNNDSYEELTNLSETIGNVEVGIKDVSKVCRKVEEKITCPICTIEYDKGVATNCNHKFCEECIYKWLETNIKCPYCFVELNEN